MQLTPRSISGPVALLITLTLLALGCSPESEPEAGWRADDEFVRAVNLGVHKMDRYEYAAAAAAFQKALEISPDSIEARVNLALATFNNTENKENLTQAAELLDQVLAKEPKNLQALYFRGVIHLDAGEPEKAIELFRQVVEGAPHDAHAWYALARAKKHAGESGKEELQRAIEENPMLSSAYYDLSQTLFREGPENRDEALRLQKIFAALSEHPLGDKMNMPMYRQMGELAVARPLSAVAGIAGGTELSFGAPQTIFGGMEMVALASGDLDGDGDLELLIKHLAGPEDIRLAVLRNDGTDGMAEATDDFGLGGIRGVESVALGDYDNDGKVDLFVSCLGPNRLFRSSEDGKFTDVTEATGTAGPVDVITSMAVFLDADHDADLDLYVCNLQTADSRPAANQLLQNNADGTFTDIAAEAGLACAEAGSRMLAPIDLDDDRDTDLVVFNVDAPVAFFRNDLLDGYETFDPIGESVVSPEGGIAQDFDGDGRPDLLFFGSAGEPQNTFEDSDGDGLPDRRVFGAPEHPPSLFLGSEIGPMRRSEQFDPCAAALTAGMPAARTRIADVDLDGDLDIITQGVDWSWLFNDGRGLFTARRVTLPDSAPTQPLLPGLSDLLDLTGDGTSDLLVDYGVTIALLPGSLTPPPNWLGLTVTGQHSQAHSTRSPVSGYGTRVEVRAGLHGQVITHTGLYGGTSQSLRPLVFGLDGATEAHYVAVRWPDAITQSETGLEANSYHVLAEMQRRPTSCPMLFAWDGERFEFVGDFAGVGGLGYYAGPGAPPPPQVKELVRIRSDQLVEKDGLFQLRAAEPMEEAGYVDRLELLVVEHDEGHEVFPDDRLVVTGEPPTQELLHVGRRFFPIRGEGPEGEVTIENLRELDRRYAYQPPHDHRFFGYCHEHELIVEFGEELSELEPGRPTYLFLGGSLEYPYSQTNFAAGQAGLTWDPPRIDRRNAEGEWETLVADAGAPGGMARTIAIDLSEASLDGPVTLRLVTNLEIYYDRLFLAQDLGDEGLEQSSAPMARAELRRLGFPQEYSPDGQHPRIYTYDIIEASFGFRRLPGTYTRYGDVMGLLDEFDDRYVVMATGDEIAVDFDAGSLPPLPEGRERTYILLSHAYCKDMDLRSVGPGTVEPLPFGEMSGYPYPEDESYPATEAIREYQAEYNTRVIR